MQRLLATVNIGDEFLLKPTPHAGGIAHQPVYQSIGGLISAILRNVYIVAGIIVFLLVLISGLMFIINAGKGESEATKKAQGTLVASLSGLLIIFLSYWIIQIIEVITGVKIFNR